MLIWSLGCHVFGLHYMVVSHGGDGDSWRELHQNLWVSLSRCRSWGGRGGGRTSFGSFRRWKAGIVWLANTTSITDLMLNAVALGAILEAIW